MSPHPTIPESGARARVSPSTAASIVLLVSFFLPWVNILGLSAAGYEVRQLWGPGVWLWAAPALAACAAALGLSGRPHVALAQVAGGVPLVFLAVAAYKFGADLFRSISYGGWLALAASLFAVCVAPRLGRARGAKSQPSPERDEAEVAGR